MHWAEGQKLWLLDSLRLSERQFEDRRTLAVHLETVSCLALPALKARIRRWLGERERRPFQELALAQLAFRLSLQLVCLLRPKP